MKNKFWIVLSSRAINPVTGLKTCLSEKLFCRGYLTLVRYELACVVRSYQVHVFSTFTKSTHAVSTPVTGELKTWDNQLGFLTWCFFKFSELLQIDNWELVIRISIFSWRLIWISARHDFISNTTDSVKPLVQGITSFYDE